MKLKWGPDEAAYTALTFFLIALIALAMKAVVWIRAAYVLWFLV